MRKTWRVKVLSGVSVLAIAGMSAAVLAAEQNKARQAIMREETLQRTVSASEEAQQETMSVSEETQQETVSVSEETQQETMSASEEAQQETVGISEETQASKEEHSTGETTSQDNITKPEESSAADERSEEKKEKQEQAKTSRAKLSAVVSEEDIDAYFDGTVLVGDSVMVGFRNYAMRRANTYLGRIQFLASGSFSVHNALWPVNAKSVHPVYQGQKRQVWESLGMIQPKRIFMFFGLNDMNMGTLDNTCATYAQVIANIKNNCPDAEIHLMSMTYTLRGKGKGNLTNPNIRTFNEMLKQMARDNGWGFVDIANPLADANGDLAPAYCSDYFVHQTNAAYDVWSVVLRDYARSQLDGTSEFLVGEALAVNFEAAGYGEILINKEEETKPSEREEIFGTSINP